MVAESRRLGKNFRNQSRENRKFQASIKLRSNGPHQQEIDDENAHQ